MLELFTGCGGLACGMQNAGFEHVAFIEKNHDACESLRANFDREIVHECDTRTFDFRSVGSVDAIAGGPPCQPFSLGGLARAYNDARDMFPEAARAIAELHPRGFVFENVKGLLRKSFSKYFSYIIKRLTFPLEIKEKGESWESHFSRLGKFEYESYSNLKYRVSFKLVNAADYGVPQIRERVFIVGLRSDVLTPWIWPRETCSRECWKTIEEALRGIPDPRIAPSPPDHKFVMGAKIYKGHTGSRIDRPSKTIKAGAHGVPGGENMLVLKDGSVRYMTVLEAKLLQTFPRKYWISGAWGEAMRQIGNAVPVRLAEIMGRQLFSFLSGQNQHVAPNTEDETGNLLLKTGV